MLSGMGIETGIDLRALAEAGQFISRHLNRDPASKVARAMAARQQASS
jgi:hydroxymethylglutaryl-CoA lyase